MGKLGDNGVKADLAAQNYCTFLLMPESWADLFAPGIAQRHLRECCSLVFVDHGGLCVVVTMADERRADLVLDK